MNKLSFACMKTKFSPVGGTEFWTVSVSVSALSKKIHLTHPSADTDTDSPIFRTLSLMKWERKGKEMLIIYFYIYIFIYKYKLSLSPFSLKGGVAEFWTVSVSVSGFAPRPRKKSSPKSGFSDFICNFALSIVGFFVSFCNTKIRWIFRHGKTLGRFCCSGYQKYNKL